MTANGEPLAAPTAAGLVARTIGFLCVWAVLIGVALPDLALGVFAAIAATAASRRLWAPLPRLSVAGIAAYTLRFCWQSWLAGLDIAQRAFAPTLRLSPGLASYRSGLEPCTTREALCATMSLQPGRLPVGVGPDGTLRIHCLDVTGPAAAETAADEAAFLRMLQKEPRRG